MVTETIRLTGPEARENRVNVTLDLGSNLPELMIEAVQIQQVIVNLERNGVEAIRHYGSIHRELTIQTEQETDEVVKISVTDTGSGICETVAKNLFKQRRSMEWGWGLP